MSRSVDLLKKRYLENMKEKPDLFVGIELGMLQIVRL